MQRQLLTPATLALLLGLGLQGAAHAGTYGDDFGKCLVRSSSDADKHALVEWTFAAISLNPAIAPYAALPADKRAAIDVAMAGLFERLVGTTCKAEASEALKYEGPQAFSIAFQLFGEVAGQQLFASPEVAKGSMSFIQHVDLDALQRGLGVKPAATP